MRIFAKAVLIAFGTCAAAAFAPAQAIEYPWCVNYGTDMGGRNCGFSTFEQCLATSRGAGGTCSQNPMYRPGAAAAARHRVRHRSQY